MRPYCICYMMTSIDGRIDCAMTEQLQGVGEYYRILRELDIPTTVSGRVTAELEMALPGKFTSQNQEIIGKEAFSRKISAPGYEVVTDSKGTLLWEKESGKTKPHLILMSTGASKAYADYLDEQNISWIACGEGQVDLVRASQILASQFGVKRMGIVGGPVINTGFLQAGLLDEIVILIGPGIDGRAEMPSLFEGRTDSRPVPLTLAEVKSCHDGAVMLRYRLIKE